MKQFPSSMPLLEKELLFFQQYLDYFVGRLFSQPEDITPDINLPKIPVQIPSISLEDTCVYAQLINSFEEKDQLALRITLLLALTPHLRPELLDVFIVKNEATGAIYTQFGGRMEQNPVKFRPTMQTLYYLLSSNQLHKREQLLEWLGKDGLLSQKNILQLQHIADGITNTSTSLDNDIIAPSPEFLSHLRGKVYIPKLSTSFPAELITTEMTWDDLVLPEKTLFQLEEIISWFKGKDNLLNNPEVKKLLRPGYRAIFHGPSGTGKTLSAQLLAKRMGLPLLKVHTPMLVSKWVGETEKNLNRLFDQASGRDWILLFDEGENLFGQRGGNSTQDQHSNQQIGFLLQKIEHHDGLIIISSNRYASMDPAFRRRFESIVRFKEPTYEERLKLWQNIFGKVEIDQREIKFEELAEHYPDMTGGYLINVLRSAWTWAYQSDRDWIKLVDILRGIQKETHKIRSGWTVKPPEENAGLTPYLDSDVWI